MICYGSKRFICHPVYKQAKKNLSSLSRSVAKLVVTDGNYKSCMPNEKNLAYNMFLKFFVHIHIH